MAKSMPPLTLKFDPKMDKFSEPFGNSLIEIVPLMKSSKIRSSKAKNPAMKTALISKEILSFEEDTWIFSKTL